MLLILFMFVLLGSCSAPGASTKRDGEARLSHNASASAVNLESGGSSAPLPEFELVIIPEMAPMPMSADPAEAVPTEIRQRFMGEWERISEELGAQLSVKEVVSSMRWPIDSTDEVKIPADWPGLFAARLHPMGYSEDRTRVFFGHETEDSPVEIPPHRMAERRLVIRVELPLAGAEGMRVYASVRGWVEE